MFCDGKCEKGRKRCGLYRTLTLEHKGKVKNLDMCVFIAMLDSMHRGELGQVRIQAAVESARNEKKESDFSVEKTIATGFLGFIHAVNENDRAKKNVKLLNATLAKQLKIEEEEGNRELTKIHTTGKISASNADRKGSDGGEPDGRTG